RRSPHARLLTLLARRPVSARPRPAQFRQAVCARLPRNAHVGQEAAGSRTTARRRGEDLGEIRRGLRANHGPAAGRLKRARSSSKFKAQSSREVLMRKFRFPRNHDAATLELEALPVEFPLNFEL